MDNIPDVDDVRNALGIKSLEYVDKGGFKAVFKGDISGKKEAVKIIYLPPPPEKPDDENDGRKEIISRIKREFESLKQCKTNYIVKLGSIDLKTVKIKNNDYLVYSEEYIEGESLRKRIENGNKPDFNELKQLITCLMEALSELCALKLIHRDIKPGNIIKTTELKRPFILLDLGIAYKIQGTELTVKDGRPGTLKYMPPELFQPNYRDLIDVRSDMYSAGVTIFEYASGRHPLSKKGEDEYTTMYKILKVQPEKLKTYCPDLPETFCKMIDRCIKKTPALRYANPSLIMQELEVLK